MSNPVRDPFPCNYGEDPFAPKADVLGIYGQNGSGKTTFIDALEILKTLLSGQKVGAELSDCISYGQEKAELQFEFSILKLNEAMLRTDGGLFMPPP